MPESQSIFLLESLAENSALSHYHCSLLFQHLQNPLRHPAPAIDCINPTTTSHFAEEINQQRHAAMPDNKMFCKSRALAIVGQNRSQVSEVAIC